MTPPQGHYRNPLDVLIHTEEKTCKGCIFREPASNGTKDYCANPNQRNPLAVKRCKHYEEPEQ